MSAVIQTPLRHSFNAFKFQVTNKSDPDLLFLKSQIAEHNGYVRKYARKTMHVPKHAKLYRVSLMGRGTRRDSSGRLLHPNADSNLQHRFARAFDVYVHEDGHNLEILRTEIDTGISPADQARIKRFEHALRLQEWNYEAELRARGIRYRYIQNEFGQQVKQYMSGDQYIKAMREEHPQMSEDTFTRVFGKISE